MKSWINPYLKQYKGRILIALLLGGLGVISGAMLLFTSGYLISKSSLKPENVMLIYIPIVAVRAFSIGQAAFPYSEKLVSHDLVLRILASMRKRLYQIVEPQALFLRSRYQTGDLLGVLSDDIEHLQDLYLRTIIPGIIGIFIYTVFIIVIGLFDISFALLMLFLVGFIVFFVPLVSFYVTRRNHLSLKKYRKTLYQQLTDAIFGITDWQASGRTKQFLTEYNENNEKLINIERKLQRWHHIRDALLQLIIGLIVIFMLIWSYLQAEQGAIIPILIAAFTLMSLSITDALVPVSDAVEHIPSHIDSIERIKHVENHCPPTSLTTEENWNNNTPATIELNQVCYQYPGTTKRVIDHLSLVIPQGKKIAILGKSGTGKSTLLKLLAGMLHPDSGEITIGGQKMQSSFLSQAVTVLNQKPHLFDTTIGNNIRIGNPNATDEEIEKAIEQAQLTDLVTSLPKGLDTPAKEMGSRFSGGERQRIALARVLLQHTPIILVDEATIGLDPHTERELLEAMLHATTDKTVIWVTHHLAGVEKMDEVIFLRDGKISMKGNHAELMATNKHYQKLYEMDQGELS